MPGLGQAFLGRYRRALAFTAAIVIAVLILKATVFLWPAWRYVVFPVFLAGVVAGVAIVLWAAIDSWRLGRRAAVQRPAWPRRYLVYFGIILAWYMPNATGAFVPRWQAFSTPSSSMAPGLQPGDYFYVLDGYYATHEPQRGDLIAFKLPCDYSLVDRATAERFASRCDRKVDFIKRIVGLPGDRVQLKQGVVFVNDVALLREGGGNFVNAVYGDEPPEAYRNLIEIAPEGARYSIIETRRGEPSLDNTEIVTVPPGRYFVLGDNRHNSADSRDPISGVGYVPCDHLIGKAVLIYFSIDGRPSAGRNAFSFPRIRWDRIGMPLC